ncbi:rRNA-processing protein [Fusarium falciforme]
MSSMITASQWVPRGFAAPFPKKYTLDEAEFERIAELAKLQLDDAQEDLEEAQESAAKDGAKDKEEDADMKDDDDKPAEKTKIDINDDDLKEYDLEHYDDDDEEEDKPGQGEGMSMFGNIKSLAYYESNKEDPYITIDADKLDEEEDREDLQILATDNLIVSAKVEDEMAHLEVYVYEDAADNLYVHHDIMLPRHPAVRRVV